MRRYFFIFLMLTFLLSGCGDVEWFPEGNSGTSAKPYSEAPFPKGNVTAKIVDMKVDSQAGDTITYTMTVEFTNNNPDAITTVEIDTLTVEAVPVPANNTDGRYTPPAITPGLTINGGGASQSYFFTVEAFANDVPNITWTIKDLGV